MPVSKKKILIVEDSLDLQMILQFFLESRGAQVMTADNGHDAIEITLKERPDMVLLDIQLPDMNGYSVVKHLQAQGIKAPFIAMTAQDVRGEREKFQFAGFSDCLSKPVDCQCLLDTLGRNFRQNSFVANQVREHGS